MTTANQGQARPEWNNARRITVKIGSALLADPASGALKQDWLEAIGDDVAALRREGRDVILVSSGAIALGRRTLGLESGPLRLEEAQAAAAVGQITLAHAYQTVFRDRGLSAAQILVTPGDTEERRRYLNARNTIGTLLKLGAVPVVNENDTVATTEIRYGDNDFRLPRPAFGCRRTVYGTALLQPGCQTARCRYGDHAGDRGDGGRCRHGAFPRGDGDEACRSEDCGGGGHTYDHRVRKRAASATGYRQGCFLHLVLGIGEPNYST